ncbi:hypothetical protein MMUC44124_01875 [Mycolicibacterium mucogenicum DSM 44124]|nr:hypothetical protein MMUC44124_01875 [Mycolicibacterium mucogenicum DSM 44124]
MIGGRIEDSLHLDHEAFGIIERNYDICATSRSVRHLYIGWKARTRADYRCKVIS